MWTRSGQILLLLICKSHLHIAHKFDGVVDA